MALLGYYLTIRLQSHSSGTANEVIADTTSVEGTFSAEALETSDQADALVSTFIVGKNKINISGDFLVASDNEQFDLLFVHMNAGDKIEVELYRSGNLLISEGEGVLTSLSLVGANSDSLVTGAYSMEVDATMSPYGPSLNISNCENLDYDTFANGTPTGFDAIYSTTGTQEAGTADEIGITTSEKYIVTFDLVLNSGTAPGYDLRLDLGGASGSDEGEQLSVSGANSFTFTASSSFTGVLAFVNDSAANYEVTNLSVRSVL